MQLPGANTGAQMRIITGAMPVLETELSDRALARRDALIAIGAVPRGVRYLMHTATVAWDGTIKRLMIAVDPDVFVVEWNEVLKIAQMAGWMIGDPRFDDIGEPSFDVVSQVWVWDLECP